MQGLVPNAKIDRIPSDLPYPGNLQTFKDYLGESSLRLPKPLGLRHTRLAVRLGFEPCISKPNLNN